MFVRVPEYPSRSRTRSPRPSSKKLNNHPCHLRDSEFGAILRAEQIDVRRFLLADSPRSLSGSPHFLANWKDFFTHTFSLFFTKNLELAKNYRGTAMAVLSLTEQLNQL